MHGGKIEGTPSAAEARLRTQLATYRDVQSQLVATRHLPPDQRLAQVETYLTTVIGRLSRHDGAHVREA